MTPLFQREPTSRASESELTQKIEKKMTKTYGMGIWDTVSLGDRLFQFSHFFHLTFLGKILFIYIPISNCAAKRDFSKSSFQFSATFFGSSLRIHRRLSHEMFKNHLKMNQQLQINKKIKQINEQKIWKKFCLIIKACWQHIKLTETLYKINEKIS